MASTMSNIPPTSDANNNSSEDGSFSLDDWNIELLKGLAEHMQKDEDNVLFRRFEYLQLYHLLTLQHELIACEVDLKQIAKTNYDRWMNATERLGALLKAYNEALDIYEKMQKRLKTPRYVRKLLIDRREIDLFAATVLYELQLRASDNEDSATLKDLISIASSADKGVLHKFVDEHEFLKSLLKRQKVPDEEGDSRHQESPIKPMVTQPIYTDKYYYSEKAVKIIENVLISALMCALIVVPVSTLSYVQVRAFKILLVLVCVIGAFLITMLLSRQTQQSNLALIIAYATLITVFLDQQQN